MQFSRSKTCSPTGFLVSAVICQLLEVLTTEKFNPYFYEHLFHNAHRSDMILTVR